MASRGTVFVIGGGTAGEAAARYLARRDWRVLLAEPDRLGGTCLWRGCVPKKALYAAARVARQCRQAETFGVTTGEVGLDWQGVLAWKWHAQETYAGDQRASLERIGVEVIDGIASFASPEQVQAGGQTYTPDHVVIATGSVPTIPSSIKGADLADTSDQALHYHDLPKSLLIVGAGFIGLEMAGVFASFGSKVTVVAAEKRILEMLDAELAAAAQRNLTSLGVRFVTETRLEALSGELDDLRARLAGSSGQAEEVSAERVLLAVGRSPAIDRLDLAAAGVETDGSGHIVHDAYLRTTNPRVWVAGDAAGGMMQTPIANLEGRTVAESIDGGTPLAPDCHAAPIACFTVPQLATVGLTEAEAERQSRAVDVTRTSIGDVAAGIIDDERDGFVKFVSDSGDGTILGAQIASPTASDLIYSAAVAVAGGLTIEQLRAISAVHPSYAEAVFWAAG